MGGETGFYRIGVKDGVIGLEGGLVTDWTMMVSLLCEV